MRLPRLPSLPALPAPLERAFARVQEVTARVIAFCQPIVVSVLLFLIYVFGVGATRLWCMVAHRRALQLGAVAAVDGSYWQKAEGYSPDLERLHKQI